MEITTMKNEDRRAGGLATARGKANAKAGKGLDKADAASSKRYRFGGLATAGSKVPEQAASGMAKANLSTAGAGTPANAHGMATSAAARAKGLAKGLAKTLPSGMREGINKGVGAVRSAAGKAIAARNSGKAFASGGYAGKTSTEARMCKPTAAKAGASFKKGK
jgi:hypothetical protein